MSRPSRAEQIMDAALSVFAQRGYDGTRIRHIAERAGVSDAAIYAHHRSKEELALALYRRHIGRYGGVLRELASLRELSVEQRIRAMALRTLERFEAEPDALAFAITHQARFIGALPVDFPYPIRAMEELIGEGQAMGAVRSGPVRLLAALVFGCITQPIRTVLDAPPGTISLADAGAQEVVADAAWRTIAAD